MFWKKKLIKALVKTKNKINLLHFYSSLLLSVIIDVKNKLNKKNFLTLDNLIFIFYKKTNIAF
jgi:hypothetical protein